MINTYEEFKSEYEKLFKKFMIHYGVSEDSIATANALDDLEINNPEFLKRLENSSH